ncbi:MAG: efflux RND transporter periplasmic adaptor subunit [Pseudomonadota bacterium]
MTIPRQLPTLVFFSAILFGLAQPIWAQSTVPVSVVIPESVAATERAELTGSFTARRSAELSAQTAGLVQTLHVDVGDTVAAGDVLLALDTSLAELGVARAEATVQERQASLDEAQRLFDEGQRLVQDRFVPETEVQAREAGVGIAEAALISAQADLATARERLRQHRVTAPFDGVIADRAAEIGEWIETGTAVMELVTVDQLWLDIRAPQQYWNSLDTDARARVSVDALGSETLAARVHTRVPVKDPDARTFLVRLVLDQPDARLTPGMSATARFEWSDGGQVLRIPRDAITRYPDGTLTVWVVDQRPSSAVVNEQAIAVASTGQPLASADLYVTAGLAPGQAIVIRGNELLSEGQPVQVVSP